jgi:undecaprenyl-diphosphatase
VIRYLVLGVVQGATEFLPISSSGHLVLFERLLGLDPPGVLLEALLHWGTLAAVLLVFRSDLADLARSLTPRGSIEGRKEIGMIAAGTVPIVVLGLLLRSSIGGLFGSMLILGAAFLATGLLLALTGVIRRRAERNRAHFADALGVGVAQAAALLPGLSRSGVTIAAGLFAGLTPRRAARFSFLLSIVARGRLWVFSIYCVGIGLFVLLGIRA